MGVHGKQSLGEANPKGIVHSFNVSPDTSNDCFIELKVCFFLFFWGLRERGGGGAGW